MLSNQEFSSLTTATESSAGVIQRQLEFYDRALKDHPIQVFCRGASLPQEVLEEFVRIQYVDSTLWVTMLALAKGKVSSPKLLQAIRANILCETGYNGIPHVTLCKQFVESVGIPALFGDHRQYAPLTSHSVEVMNAFDYSSDAVIAGWLLVAESLVPTLFSAFRPAFAEYTKADLRYLDEHIAVDSDEHAKWMFEAALEIADRDGVLDEVLQGIHLGGRATLSVPDALYAKTLRLKGAKIC